MKKQSFLQKFMTAHQVTMADWLDMKPYEKPFPKYDEFYVRQAQTVHDVLNEHLALFQKYDMSRSQMKQLSCQLASYFEDYITEIGIWRAYIAHNKETFGYPLPFYDLYEYDETYINIEDIAYLIWHYLTKYSPAEYITDPHSDSIMAMATDIFDHFENVMEQAPGISMYSQFFNIKDNEDYFMFKTKMKWFATKSYLLGVDLGQKFEEMRNELAEDYKNKKDTSAFGIVIYSLLEKYLYQKRSSYSALNGPELFAKIAQGSDTRRQEIIDLTYWIGGKFWLKSIEKSHFIFEHILTKVQYKVLKSSFQNNKDFKPSDTQAFNMHFIRWQNEYLLSGMMYTEKMTPASILEYKKMRVETPWILSESDLTKMIENTHLMYEAFVEFFGSPLAVFDTDAQATKGNMAYITHYHNKLKKLDLGADDDKIDKNLEQFKQTQGMKSMVNDPNFKESVALFYNKDVGISSFGGIKETIQFLTTSSLNVQQQVSVFVDIANGFQPEICTHLLEKYGTANLLYPKNPKVDVVKHLPFFWRMNSPEEFDRVYPNMTLVNSVELDA